MPASRGALAAPFAICLLSATATNPAAPLTEAEAIRLFLSRNPLVRLGTLRAEALDAAIRAEAPVRNPDLFYSVEDAGDTRDEFFVVEQELPITGRRSLIRRTAERASTAALLAAEDDLRRTVHELRSTFYAALHGRHALDLLRGGAEELERTIGILQEREATGEGSGYDLVRTEQELAGLAVRIGRAETELAAAVARLESFFPESSGLGSEGIHGDFVLGEAPPSAEDAVAFALAHRPDLLALEAAGERHDLDSKVARRRRLPEPILAAGFKRVESAGESDGGYVASVTIPLPLFDRGQIPGSRARAEAGVVEAERELLRRHIEAEVIAAHARALTTREVARSGGDVEARAAALVEISRVAYEEGEHGILERLDAHRTSLQGRLLALEVRYEAKRAEIELDRSLGREVRP